MTTIPTPVDVMAQRLLERVGPLSGASTLPVQQLPALAGELLPHTDPDSAAAALLDITDALTNVELFTHADEHFLNMWPHAATETLQQWGHERAEAWRELAWTTAINAVEADRLHAARAA